MIIPFLKIDALKAALEADNSVDDFKIVLKTNNKIAVYICLADMETFDTADLLEKIDIKETANIEIETLKKEDIEEDIFYKNLFSEEIESIIYKKSRRRFDSFLNDDLSSYLPPCPVVTFYSYKGGLGRSTTLACYAAYIARHKGAKVFIIDCDFEAPGFTNFYLDEPYFPNQYNGLIEYLNDKHFLSSSELSLDNYTWEVSKSFSGEGEIRIMPAGNLDSEFVGEWLPSNREHYIEGLSRLDLNSYQSVARNFRELIDNIHKTYTPHTIVIDSRTGFNDIFGLATLGLSNFVLGFFGNSVQNLPGLHFFIDFLRTTKKKNFLGAVVNSFSRKRNFEHFSSLVDEYAGTNELDKFYFGRQGVLERIGTVEEDKQEFIDFIEYKESKEYTDLFEFIYLKANDIRGEQNSTQGTKEKDIQSEKQILTKTEDWETETEVEEVISEPLRLKRIIIENLLENWSQLYAENIENFDTEFQENRYFYRDCMLDLFNLNRFIILGNKGTGKTYIYQSLKNENIVAALKEKAKKSDYQYLFFHLVDEKKDLFFDTVNFTETVYGTLQKDLFYRRFWLIYTWRATMKIAEQKLPDYDSKQLKFEGFDTETAATKTYVKLIKDENKIIEIEKDLKRFDEYLFKKTDTTYVTLVLDDLDVMVKPHLWAERIAPLLNFWKRHPYKRLVPKLFVRRDLFNKISGVTNLKELENQAIDIEWTQEELFAYFFKLVFSKTQEDFFEFARINKSDDGALKQIQKKVKDAQPKLDEGHLRILCKVFFGKYAGAVKYGSPYDWIFKNLKNADETISLRPFIDLLKAALKEASREDKLDDPILPSYYYTNRQARIASAENYFNDLAKEKGNKDLERIFEFIRDENHKRYKYQVFNKAQLWELLGKIIEKYGEQLEYKSEQDLVDLLKVNGIIDEQSYGHITKYSFAYLYKYYLGLKDRKGR